MSSTLSNFSKQQELANKKYSKLEDHEKMYLMRKEIDNLRNIVRTQNGGSLKTATSSNLSASTTTNNNNSNNASMAAPPVFSLMALVVGVLLLVTWWRKRRPTTSYSRFSTRRSSENPEITMAFELQQNDTAFYRAAESSADIQFV